MWTPHPKGAKPKDVFEIPTLSNSSWEREKHPTQKPVGLVRKCILASSNQNDLIVDPFGGSGTTFAVSEAFGRKWLGCDNKNEYCNIIKAQTILEECCANSKIPMKDLSCEYFPQIILQVTQLRSSFSSIDDIQFNRLLQELTLLSNSKNQRLSQNDIKDHVNQWAQMDNCNMKGDDF